jgi:hypothetical protein
MKAQVWISKPEVRRQVWQAQVPARYLVGVVCCLGLGLGLGSGLVSVELGAVDEVGGDREVAGRRYHFSQEGLDMVSAGVLQYGRSRSG